MIGERFRQWSNIAAFALAYASIAFIGWAARVVAQQPYDGLDWVILTGQVYEIDPDGPANNLLQPGDVILAVDDVNPNQALPLYFGKEPGDTVTYSVERNSHIYYLEISLTTAPLSVALQRMVFFLIALAFWLVGVAVIAFAQATKKAGAFFLWCITCSIILSSGALSPTGPSWVSSLFNIFLWVMGPLSIHFHLIFLEISFPFKRGILGILYGFAVVCSLPFAIWGANIVRASEWMEFLYSAGRLNIVVSILFSIALLAHTLRASQSIRVKQQIRLVTLSGSLALMPAVILNFIPGALFKQEIVPYHVSFMFLAAIPVGYGYAIVRHQLIKLDRFLNRGVTSTLVITLLAALYLGFAALMDIIFPEQAQNELLIRMLIAIALAVIYPQVRHMVQRLIDWFFYGGWYDYRTAVEQITQSLEFIFDSKVLAQTLSARVRETLRLESAATLLLEPYGEICEVDGAGLEIKDFELPWKHSSPMIPEDGYIYKYLQEVTSPLETRYIRKALTGVSLADGERKLLSYLESRIWVPIHGHKSLLGLLILGPRLGNEAFSAIDMDILQMVVQHVGACAQNLVLLNELRLHASQVEQLHRRILRTREEERKLLARELHDDVIQALVSLNFELSRAVEENRDHLKGEIRNLLGTIRGICRQLRPPALDNLGLITATRSLIREFKEMNDEKLHIDFHTNINEELWVKEEIAVCLYRVLNEGLRNIVSHAKADRVNIELARDSNEIRLIIVDNGVGFTIPPNLGLLIANDHFGLVGIREWMELVDGNLEIKSSPGNGTVITARVSIPQSDTIESEDTEGAIK